MRVLRNVHDKVENSLREQRNMEETIDLLSC